VKTIRHSRTARRRDSDAIQTISNGKERKKYCYTILAYGVDNDAGGSDTNMLVRFDAENKKIDVVSLRSGHADEQRPQAQFLLQ